MSDAIREIASAIVGNSSNGPDTPSHHHQAVLFASEDPVLSLDEQVRLISVLHKDICMVDTYSTLSNNDEVHAEVIHNTL